MNGIRNNCYFRKTFNIKIMKPNKQILWSAFVAVVLFAASVFTGCKKVATEWMVVTPWEVMLTVGSSTTLTAHFEPSNATNTAIKWSSGNPWYATVKPLGKKGDRAYVIANAIGETTIYCISKEGGFTSNTKVIINPVEDENDYATLVPSFYFGAFNENYIIGGPGPHITVKYHSNNKIVLSINDCAYPSYLQEDWGSCIINVNNYVAELIKIDYHNYGFVGKIPVLLNDTYYLADIEGIFTTIPEELEMTLKVKDVPGMDEILITYKGYGSKEVGKYPPYPYI